MTEDLGFRELYLDSESHVDNETRGLYFTGDGTVSARSYFFKA